MDDAGQGGLKYLLPALPLWADTSACARGGGAPQVRTASGRADAFDLGASVHRVAPDYLMYFNALAGGLSEGGRIWSTVRLGQGQRRSAPGRQPRGSR